MLGSASGIQIHTDRVVRKGRLGVSYFATDKSTGELLVAKLFAPTPELDGPIGHRFRSELDLLAQISHSGLIAPALTGRINGRWIVAAPYFPAESLESETAEGPFTEVEAIALLRQLAGTLALVHARGLIHGSLLPRRILVSRIDGMQVAVTNPGRHILAELEAPAAGDPAFAAPEQDSRFGFPVDRRADFYALGRLALFALGARAADSGPSPHHSHAHSNGSGLPEIADQTLQSVTPELGSLIGKLVAISPEDRPPTAQQVLHDLERLANTGRNSAPRRVPLGERRAPLGAMTQNGVQTIRAGLGQAKAGLGKMIVLEGWDGMGTDRLLREAVPAIEEAGALLLQAIGSAGESVSPLSAVRQWIADFQNQIERMPWVRSDMLKVRIDQQTGRWPSGLGAMLPELPGEAGEAQAPHIRSWSPVQQARERYHVLGLVSSTLLALADTAHPLVLWIRDLAEMDPDSLQVLRMMLHQNRELPLLVLAGHRSAAGPSNPEAESLLESLAACHRLERAALPLLSQRETELQVAHALNAPAGWTRAIAERTYLLWLGVPWAQEQTLTLLREEGALPEILSELEDKPGLPDPGETLQHWTAPDSLEALILRRFATLPEDLQSTLYAASVLGSPFNEYRLSQVCIDAPLELVCSHVQQALTAGWLRQHAMGYSFAEPLVRRTLYTCLPFAMRQRLHRAASEGSSPWEASGHLLESGSVAEFWGSAQEELGPAAWAASQGSLLSPIVRSLPSIAEPQRTAVALRCAQSALALNRREMADEILHSLSADSVTANLLAGYLLPPGPAISAMLLVAEQMGEPLSAGLSGLVSRLASERSRSDRASGAPLRLHALPLPGPEQVSRLAHLDAAAELLQEISRDHAAILNTRILDLADQYEIAPARRRAWVRLAQLNGLPDGFYFYELHKDFERDENPDSRGDHTLARSLAAKGQSEYRGAVALVELAQNQFERDADALGLAACALADWELARVTGPLTRLEECSQRLRSSAHAIGCPRFIALATAAGSIVDALAGRCSAATTLESLTRICGNSADQGLPWPALTIALWGIDLALNFRDPALDQFANGLDQRASGNVPESKEAEYRFLTAERLLARCLAGSSPAGVPKQIHAALAEASAAAPSRREPQGRVIVLNALAALEQGNLEQGVALLEEAISAAEQAGAQMIVAHLQWRLAEGLRNWEDRGWLAQAGRALTAYDALGVQGLTSQLKTWLESAPEAPKATPIEDEATVPAPLRPATSTVPRMQDDPLAETDSDGTVGILCGRIRGPRGNHSSTFQSLLDRYYKQLEFSFSLHHIELRRAASHFWTALAPGGVTSAFWAAHTIRPLVTEFYEDSARQDGDRLILRTGLGIAKVDHPTVTSEGLSAESGNPDVFPAALDTAQRHARELAELSAFLRAGAIVSPDVVRHLAPALTAALRPLGPWALSTESAPVELLTLAGPPDPPLGKTHGMHRIWEEALAAYRIRDWSAAVGALRTYLERHPADRLARLMLRYSRKRLGERMGIPGTAL